jgi:hypothetical protein
LAAISQWLDRWKHLFIDCLGLYAHIRCLGNHQYGAWSNFYFRLARGACPDDQLQHAARGCLVSGGRHFCDFGTLHVGIHQTKMGKAHRATAENTDTANILGINTNMVIVITVMLASALGGVAGILIGMAYSALIPTMGMTLGFKGLAVLILGGVGSIPGAMVCGVLLGIIEVFTVAYGDSSYRDAVAFGLIILILLLKPEGLFGRKA